MRYDEACRVVRVLPVRNPCVHIVMIGRGTDMLIDGDKVSGWLDDWILARQAKEQANHEAQ